MPSRAAWSAAAPLSSSEWQPSVFSKSNTVRSSSATVANLPRVPRAPLLHSAIRYGIVGVSFARVCAATPRTVRNAKRCAERFGGDTVNSAACAGLVSASLRCPAGGGGEGENWTIYEAKKAQINSVGCQHTRVDKKGKKAKTT